MNLSASPAKLLKHEGELALRFENCGNKTVMTDCYQVPPLKASRELYVDPRNSGRATVYMMETSGGLVSGDHNDFRIEVGTEADACLIPQSATKVYPSINDLWSSQNIHVELGKESRLEWKTEAVIPYQDAKFSGQTIVNMAPDATLLWGEILSPGRDKRGERFQYGDMKTRYQVWMEGECIIYDSLWFSPEHMLLDQRGLLEQHLYVGSLWFVSPCAAGVKLKDIHEKLLQSDGMKASVTSLENKAINFRWLATDLVVLKKEMNKACDELPRNQKE